MYDPAVLDRSLEDQFAAYESAAGAIGLGGKVIFPCSRSIRLATVGHFRETRLSEQRRFLVQSNSVADMPSVRKSNDATKPFGSEPKNKMESLRLNVKLTI